MNLLSQTGHKWIGSDRLIDRRVFSHEGKFVGDISRLLIDRRSGHVDQVVVHTHGRFGFGAFELELPWAALTYDTTLPGYRLALGVSGSPAHDG